MNAEGLKQELEQLRQEIRYHNYRYHVLDDPIISDNEFDQMFVRLREIEDMHPDWIAPDSPTQRIGAIPAERFKKVHHPGPILSLNNAFSEEDVRAWFERIAKLDERVRKTNFVVEPKIDGLTVVLHYRNGVFVRGATRGDGEIGEDITNNIRTIRSLPLRIPVKSDGPHPPKDLIIRGEAFINIHDFEELNKRLEEAGEQTYQNPRNTAAGSLRQLDPKLAASRPITLLVYAIIDSSDNGVATQWELLNYLRELGFPVTDQAKYCENLEAVLDVYNLWQERRSQIPFEVDGLVIKINDLQLVADLGFVGKDPRGAIAFKFPAKIVQTKLLDIGINVGRTGVLTPYAIMEPVEIGGVIVKKATLHNFDFIKQKDIRIGDRVHLKRAGDVIPYIIGQITKLRNGKEKIFIPPNKCPACGEQVENFKGEVAWYCINAACPAQIIRNMEHFVSRSAMDIEGLGFGIVKQLVGEGLIDNVADLYSLNQQELLKLEGFAEKKANNLIQAINTSKSQSLQRLINALGIRGVGEVAAAELARNYRNLDELSKANAEELMNIEGFGPNIAKAVEDWFKKRQNKQMLNKFRSAGVWPVSELRFADKQRIFQGKVFVITGTLSGFKRQEVKEFIQSHGGKVTENVSKNTDYLVAGKNPGSKFDKARALEVEIISGNKLREMAGN
ncbi:MAG TPA: NAD-dependent DNA ligase LigA [Anaerolineae bacterium]|nr:NAD-dependent DNA ligase LigA [Anaerolineae bacterium]